MNALWNDLAGRAGMTLSAGQHARLTQFLDLLLAANQRMNLTRIVSRQEAEVAHVGDALTLLPFIPAAATTLVDIGSGGGVPGLVLAIARADLHVTLVESTRKKARFLEESAAALGLANVTVVAERAETVGQSALRQTFDIATARAVGELVWLAEWCLPLVKKGGKVLAMKGQKIAEELPAARKAIRLLGGSEPAIHPVQLPGTDHLVIVEIKKTGKTDPRYPRAATVAKGRALA